MKRLANWQEHREAQRQLAAEAKAQAEAHWRALPNLAKAQEEVYRSDLRNVASAESQVKTCQINVINEEQKVEDAQKQFDQAKAKYDQFMATQPLRTNAVYVRIKKDLTVQTGLIALQQQRIESNEEGVGRTSQPGTPATLYTRNGWRYSGQSGEGSRIALNQAHQGNLIAAQNELANAYAQINADQRALTQIEGAVVAFQENKLHAAKSALDAAGARLTEAKSSLVAAKQSLDEYKERAASSSAAAKSVLEEYRSATFPSSK